MKTRLFCCLIFSIVSTLLHVDVTRAAGSLSTILNQDEIRISHLHSVDFQINSVNGTDKSLFLNGDENSHSEDGFSVKVSSRTNIAYILTVTPIRPVFNAQYSLLVSQDQNGSNGIELQVSINLNPEAEDLFHVDGFSFECSSTGAYVCTVDADITGAEYEKEYEMWIPYKSEISTRTIGTKKWKPLSSGAFNLSETAEYAVSKYISVPTEVAAKVTYGDKIYNFVAIALPIPTLTLSAPGSAFVGKNFILSLTGSKRYSANCTINGSTKVTIKSGVGKVALYGKYPGNLHLFVICKANNSWALASQWRDIYIRA